MLRHNFHPIPPPPALLLLLLLLLVTLPSLSLHSSNVDAAFVVHHSSSALSPPVSSRTVDAPAADHIPPPWLDVGGVCRPLDGSRSVDATAGLCDPSGLLSRQRETALNRKLSTIFLGQSPYSLISCGSAPPSAGFRVAMLIVRRMQLAGTSVSSSSTAAGAKMYADTVFSQWGLGSNCRASVLVFVSLEDRKMYIKTGALAAKFVTASEISHVFSVMAPLLGSGYVFQALDRAIDEIGALLQQYHPANTPPPQQQPPQVAPPPPPPPPPASTPPQQAPRNTSPKSADNERRFGPLFWKSGPEWFDLEMSIVVLAAALCVVFACCNGIGGPDAARAKRERRYVLQQLEKIRTEYIRSTLPDYEPSNYPAADGGVPAESAMETNPLLTNPTGGGNEDGNEGYQDFPPQDYKSRLEQLRQQFPHILTPAVHARIASTSPMTWPDTLTDSFIAERPSSLSRSYSTSYNPTNTTTTYEGGQQAQPVAQGGSGGGSNWLGNVGGMLAAGGVGAILGSMLTNATNNNNTYNGGNNDGGGGGWVGGAGGDQQQQEQSFNSGDGGQGASFGSFGQQQQQQPGAGGDGGQGASFGSWFGQQQQQQEPVGGGDDGYGASFGVGGGQTNWFAQQHDSTTGDAGYGGGWGAFAQTMQQDSSSGGWSGGGGGGGGDSGGDAGDGGDF